MSALLDSAAAQIGKLHDGPDVVRLAREIAAMRPQEASYWAEAGPSTAWCGIFQEWNLLKNGYPMPRSPGPDGTGGMWVNWWLDYGAAIPAGQERPGDLALWLDNPHHISMVAGGGQYVGGNQGDTVSKAHYRTPDAIRRPPGNQVDAPINPVPFAPLNKLTIDAITVAAAQSDLARYSWRDRGVAPIGYIKGVAVAYGTALRRLMARDSTSLAMVRVVDGDGDVFDHYASILLGAGMVTLDAPDIDRLRYLWCILCGLGMRESSGNFSEGRDQSASNVSSDTCEAGLFQMSWNASGTSPEIPLLLDAYDAGEYAGYVEIFREGVSAKITDNYGSGDGERFQRVAKTKPAFACESAAIGLRTLYNHWGPIVRFESEVVAAADVLFRQVQVIVGAQSTQPAPVPPPIPIPIPIPPIPIPPIPPIQPPGIAMDEKLKLALITELCKPEPDIRTIQLGLLNVNVVGQAPLPTQPFPPFSQPVPNVPIALPAPPVVPPPTTDHATNWGAAIAAAIGALGLGAGGVIGTPVGPDFSWTGLISTVGPLVLAGAWPLIKQFLPAAKA